MRQIHPGCAMLPLVITLTVGCTGPDPICLSPPPGCSEADADARPVTEPMLDLSTADVRDMEPPPPPAPCADATPGVDPAPPDERLMDDALRSLIYAECASCHNAAMPDPSDRAFDLVTGPPGRLDDAQRALNARETASFVEVDDPAGSEIIAFHGDGDWRAPSERLTAALVAWIAPPAVGECAPADMGVPPPDADPGVDPRGTVCEFVPGSLEGTGFPRAFREAYTEPDDAGETVDDVLVESCASGACHVVDGVGEGYVLMTDGDGCAVVWNFLSHQWFVDARELEDSPLLSKPLQRRHGGAVVFAGRDDPRYLRLLEWLRLGYGP